MSVSYEGAVSAWEWEITRQRSSGPLRPFATVADQLRFINERVAPLFLAYLPSRDVRIVEEYELQAENLTFLLPVYAIKIYQVELRIAGYEEWFVSVKLSGAGVPLSEYHPLQDHVHPLPSDWTFGPPEENPAMFSVWLPGQDELLAFCQELATALRLPPPPA